MVKTLFKHEAKAYLHTLVPMNIILLGIALLTRVIWIFESDETVFEIVGISSIVALVIAMIVSIVMSFAFSIVRFYKNLFTAEGYLTMTLPVSPAQHIFSKLICAVGFNLLTIFVVFVASALAMAGDMFVEVLRVLNYFAEIYFETFTADGVFWVIELAVAFLISMFCQFLLYYACISIGQLARKNRVIAAFAVFIGYYFLMQILGTVLIIVMTTVAYSPLIDPIIEFVDHNPRATMHIVYTGIGVFNAALAAIFYFITHRIMNRKLNLE